MDSSLEAAAGPDSNLEAAAPESSLHEDRGSSPGSWACTVEEETASQRHRLQVVAYEVQVGIRSSF